MHEVDMAELKKIQLEILDNVKKFCDEKGISYWLDCGTLLGAVRHKGYIPWDDDIDIGMLRNDYERFIKEYNDEKHRYKCCTINNTKGFYYSFAKIVDTKTELYEPSKKKGRKIGIYIDIFAYDNAPTEKEELEKMYDRVDRMATWYRRRVTPNHTTGTLAKRIVGWIVRHILCILPISFYRDRWMDSIKKYINVETGYVGNFTSDSRILCDKSIFDEFVDLEFEGKQYKAPKRYDEWLKAFYGDYMQLPPEEKRVSKHQFEAFAED